MSLSRYSVSSMEQGELEASPADLRHSPQIILEPDESSDPPFEFVRGGRAADKMKMKPVEISSPDRCILQCYW